jgi:hypothetical protein
MNLIKIHAKDLKQPDMFWRSVIYRTESGFRKIEIDVRTRSESGFSDTIMTLSWQLDTPGQAERHGLSYDQSFILQAYGFHVDLPMEGHRIETALKIVKKLAAVTEGWRCGRTIVCALRVLKGMGIRRYFSERDGKVMVPRRYWSQSATFAKAFDLVAV